MSVTSHVSGLSIDVVLRPYSKISGIVVDETGASVSQVVVNAWSRDGGPTLASSAVSSDDGTFSIDASAMGEYALQAVNFIGEHSGAAETRTEAGSSGVVVRYIRMGRIKGIVVTDSMEPVDVFTVAIADRVGSGNPYLGQDGTFEISGVAPGMHTLLVRGRGFQDKYVSDIALEPGADLDIGVIRVQQGRRVFGYVVDPSGAAIRGAKVTVDVSPFGARNYLDSDIWFVRSAESDNDGAFSVAGCPMNSRRQLIGAEHPLIGRSDVVRLSQEPGDYGPVTLVVRGVGDVSGVVLMDGTPVGGATVWIGDPEMLAVFSDNSGSFLLRRIPAGMRTLYAVPPWAPTKQHSVEANVTAGGVVQLVVNLHR
jgi:hypothetical protein